jgi:DNA end-binding protein Ku
VISRRERIVMLEPRDRGLVATTRQYASEIGNAAEYFDGIPDVKLPGEMIQLAEHILETKAGHFDPSEFEDRYETAVVEMLNRKQAGMPIERQPEPAAPTNVVNLMDALRRSVEASEPGGAAAARRSGRRRRKWVSDELVRELERRVTRIPRSGSESSDFVAKQHVNKL